MQTFADIERSEQRSVILGAEAGGGKSRLIREFTGRISERALVLTGACIEQSEAGLPYAPFTAALRQWVRVFGLAEINALLQGNGTRELAWLLPEFGDLPLSTDPNLARARLFEVLRKLFEDLARRRPLVLVIEDVHWSDPSTRDLLAYLFRSLQQMSLLLIMSYRTDELHSPHPLRMLLAELARIDGVVALTLPRLSRSEVAGQLEGMLGRPPEAAVVNAVHRRSEGVPLFTEVLIDAAGAMRVGIPGSLRDLLLRTVQELSPATQKVLRTAAIGGVRVGHELLARVMSTGDAALAEALRPAVAANVVVCDEDGYAFRHSLIREAVRDDLLAGERAGIHRAYAEALETSSALGPDRWVSMALARHWQGAHDDERALRAAWQAAGEAGNGLAYAEQLEMLEQVLELWPRVSSAAERTGTDRAGAFERAADAACWAVESERGFSHVESALRELSEERDGSRVAALLLQRAIMRQQGLLAGELEDLEAALRLATRPTRLRAETLGQLCRALMLRDRFSEVKPLAKELLDLAALLRDEEYEVEARIIAAQLQARAGADSDNTLSDALRTARDLGSGRLEVLAYAALLQILEDRGDHALAVETGRAALARTIEVGQARYMGATIAHLLCRSLASAGRWDEALDVVREALALDPAPLGRSQLLPLRGHIAVARGDLRSEELISQELRSLPDGPQNRPQRTIAITQLSLESLLGRFDFTAALAIAATVPALSVEARTSRLRPLLAAAMRACFDADGPATLRKELEAVAGDLPMSGPVDQAYALVFAAEASRSSKPDPAPWDKAVAAWEGLDEPYQQAYALLRGGAAAAAGGSRESAAGRLRRALGLATALEARPLVEWITSVARRARVKLDIPEATPTPENESSALTERELDVLRLIAAGRSNREIALELFISPKTASVHVSNILAKLNVATRGAAAAAAHRLHLLDRM